MNPERLVNVRQKSTAVICCVLLASMMLVGYMRQIRRASSSLDEPARQRRSSLENDTLPTAQCTQQLIPVDGTFEDMVDMLAHVTDDYVSLVRISVTYENGNLSENQSGDTWHWALGARGRFMLTFPFNYYHLSLTTLGYGMHTLSISLKGSNSHSDSVSEICLGYSLSKLLKEVRSSVKNVGGLSADDEEDVICKERISDSPSFGGTYIPGYSAFEVQAMFHYECWNVNLMDTCVGDSCRINHSFRINCSIVNIAFWITLVLVSLVLFVEICYCMCSKPLNHEDEVFGENINILQINFIVPVFLMFNSKLLTRLYNGCIPKNLYRISLFAIPVILHLVFFFSLLDGERRRFLKLRSVVLLVFAYILYGIGVIIFIVCKNQVCKSTACTADPNNVCSKMERLGVHTVVVHILCCFLLSATAMFVVEILVLAVIGISVNIRYGEPLWINVIVGAFLCMANIVQFFDSYQNLFSMIYSVGTQVDRKGNFDNKIFEQSSDGSPQMEFKIKTKLLRDIIQKMLPFLPLAFKTFIYMGMTVGFLVILGVVVFYIDQLSNSSTLADYFLTVSPLFIAAVVKLTGIPITAGGKEKTRSEDKRLQLEKDLTIFAKTGVFPLSHSWCGRWCPCCADQQDQTQNPPTASDVQQQNRPSAAGTSPPASATRSQEGTSGSIVLPMENITYRE